MAILTQSLSQCDIRPWLTIDGHGYHNVTLDQETIFFTMWLWLLTMSYHGWPRLTMDEHGWPWWTMVEHGWENLCHNVMLEHGWPWLIFILRQSLSQCDIGWFSYWENLCHNVMLDHGWDNDWFSYWNNICHNATMDHACPWLTMVEQDWFHKTWLTMIE